MRKRIALLAMAALILTGFLPEELYRANVAQANSAPVLKYGDYFVLGSYLGEEIVWRHVGSDGYGDVALSFRIITSKAYNSTGIKPANISVPDGVQIPREVDPSGERAKIGSNIWVNSTLRAWLNSDAPAGQVRYIGNAPSSGDVTANAYDNEAGFLRNFTDAERMVMLPTQHGSALNEVDIAIRTAGSQVPGWDNGFNLTDPIRHMVTDTVFLPDAYLLSRIASASSLDWTVGYWSAGFHRAGITEAAVLQAQQSGGIAQQPSGEYNAVDYWTGTPMGSQWDGTHQMQTRLVGGGHAFVNVNNGVMGVRPAFYLNCEAIDITGGSGTQEDPYVIGTGGSSFNVILKGDNQTKIYTPDWDILQVITTAAAGIDLSYITIDPEEEITISDESAFNSYSPKLLIHRGGKASIKVNENCTVWIMAKADGHTLSSFKRITYKNFYDPVQLLQEGKIKDTQTYLYRNAGIEGIYGVPINKYKTPHTLISDATYDEVPLIDALPEHLAPYWKRVGDSPAGITLNDISYYSNSPATITSTYEKNENEWWTVHLEFVDESGVSIDMDEYGQLLEPFDAEAHDELYEQSDDEVHDELPESEDVETYGELVTGVTLTNFMPAMAGHLSDFGLSYDLPVGENYYPYAWKVDDGETITPGESNVSSDFDPYITADNQTITIYYKPDRVTVTERFILDGTEKELRDKSVQWAAYNDFYKKLTSPKIDHYVVAGYQIDGKNRVDLEYASGSWNSTLLWQSITENLTQNTEITFFFIPDVNGDGVPDTDQYRITAQWIGVYADGTETTIKQKYIWTRADTFNAWANASDTANDGAEGDNDHKIAAEGSAQWIFDDARSEAPAFQTVKQQELKNVHIHFYYDYDSTGIGVPDNKHGVNEQSAVYDGSSLNNPLGWAKTFTGVVIGGRYSSTVPSRSGYAAVGWLLDDEDISSLRPFMGGNRNRAILQATTTTNHTVTFVYRAAAAPVTIRWVGTALTGHKVEFGHVTAHGYVGEIRAINVEELRKSVSVNENTWNWNESKTSVTSSITFSQTEQELIFHYDEIGNFAYDVHLVSNDGKVNIEYQIPVTTATPSFTAGARNIPLYAYQGYEIWEFDRIYDKGTEPVVTLEPSKGTMSVYFYYVPAVANVTVKAVEKGTGKELFTRTYADRPIGQEFSVLAPYVEGWSLVSGESVIRKVNVEEGGNTVTFEYERPTSVFIHCIEMRDGKETVLRTVPVANTDAVLPPDLTGDYFDFDSSNPNNPNEPYIVTNADFSSGRVIKYYYKSRVMNVRIVAVDNDNVLLLTQDLTDEARVGEMYIAAAPAALIGYALNDEPVKEVYADPQFSNTMLIVIFKYHKLAPGEVTVRHYYMDDVKKVVLGEFSIKVPIGSQFTAMAEYFPGFGLADPGKYQQTITVGGGNQVVEFVYADVRKTVTVQVVKNGTLDGSLTQTAKIPEGITYTVLSPYVSDFFLIRYKIDDGDERPAGLALINTGLVTGDVTVTLYYVNIIKITVVGKEDNTDGMELFRFAEGVRYGQSFTIDPANDLPKLDLWKLADGQDGIITLIPTKDKTIEFYYASTLATVTINAVLSGDTPVPGFTPITVNDVLIGGDFSYDAPYIPGYMLVDGEAATQTISPVSANATITFRYEPLRVGNIHVILKEGDTNGRIIATEEYTLTLGSTMTIAVPDLSAVFYTALSTPETVTYSGTDLTVEYYYERHTVQVIKKTYEVRDGDFKLIASFDMGRYRIGEIAIFHAPSKDGYELNDAALKLLRIAPPVLSSRVANYQEVAFYYIPIAQSGKLVVEAVNESGNILLTYHVQGEEGESITVSAPDAQGYTLKPGEPMSKSGVVSGKVRFYYIRKDGEGFADMTVMVRSAKTGEDLDGVELIVKSGDATVRINKTDANGEAVLYDLPTGEYKVTAKLAGYNEATEAVMLNGDQTVKLALGKIDSGGNSGAVPDAKPPSNEASDDTILPEDNGLLKKTLHKKYIRGYNDGTVRPDGRITRAEAAAIFFQLLKEPQKPGNVEFADVNGDAWYAGAVNALASMGIVKGYGDGSFRPDRPITRAEFVVIASVFGTFEKTDIKFFSDVGEGHWAASYISSAHSKGWVSGYPSGKFMPDNHLTRGEAVTIINRILGRKVKSERIPQSANVFTDLPENHWAYADLLEASTDHDYKRDENGYEIWETYKR